MLNEKLAEEIHKPTIRKFEKWKVYWSFKGNIWVADLADRHQEVNIIKDFVFTVKMHGMFIWKKKTLQLLMLFKMYSTHNEGKSVIAEKFSKILKTKIYKYK